MKLITLKCPNCGAQLNVDANKESVYCEHCGTRILIDDEINRLQIDNAEEAGYQFEKGRQRAQSEIHQRDTYQNTQPSKKKRKTWLWVLGWIFIFPLPLTILLLRKKEMKAPLKYGIIAVAWILYLIIGLSGGINSSTSQETVSAENRVNESTIAENSSIRSKTENSDEEINIFEVHFTDTSDVFVKVGEKTKSGIVRVTLKNNFIYSSDDVQLISENHDIAVITLLRASYGKTVYYEIEGISPGETYVYATSKDGSVVSEKVKVVVPAPVVVESVSIDLPKNMLAISEAIQATAIISPTNADNQELTWSSSDDKVVSINDKGLITAISEGNATITATASNGVLSTAEISVDGTKRLMNIRVTHPRDDDNNIGDEWSYITEINGERTGREIIVSVGDKLKCYAKFTETDDNPDVGEASKTYTVTKDDILNGFTITMDLYVKENGGRNSGKSAHFTVTFAFTIK